MGQDVDREAFGDHDEHHDKVRRCLDALARMLDECDFSIRETKVGIEIELNLIDEAGDPALKNAEALAAIDDEDFQTELAQYNIEVNIPPVVLAGPGLDELHKSIRDNLNVAQDKAARVGAHLMLVGILPTVREEHFAAGVITPNPRYQALADEVLDARGGHIDLSIEGREGLTAAFDTIMPEAACTSTQLHLQVEPDQFGAVWNAAQMIAAAQVALGANSPFLLGRQLWHETRIPLFEQSVDLRSEQQRADGALPRVFFGSQWITSILDLFEENLDRFPPLLPVMDEQDPIAELDAGRLPSLAELKLHNGTIYRWNRPVVDESHGRPHLRVENRVLPAGPTVIDTVANAAFFFGLVNEVAASGVWAEQAFDTAQADLYAAAQHGMDVELQWPGRGRVAASELIDDVLLPLADRGLHTLGVDAGLRRSLLEVLVGRCRTKQTGAAWQISEFERQTATGASREAALRAMTLAYEERMHTGEPVHTW